MTELLIKNIISSIMFNNLNESADDVWIVDYIYDNLMLEKLLYGEPITVPELRSLLRKKILNFEFIKLDGEVRPAKGTTMMKYVPPSQHPKGIRPSSPKVATFYDLKKDDWRSVSQRSKEIVLKKDEETGKPVVMVKDKPEAGEITPPKVEPTPVEEPMIEPIEEPTDGPIEQPEIDVDGQPLNPKEPETTVKSVKPVESTEERENFYFVNPDTGASKQIEMTPAEVIKELKKLGKGWELSDEEPIISGDEEIGVPKEPEEDTLAVGDKRDYLNRFGQNVEIELLDQDEDGNFYARPLMHYIDVKGENRTKKGPRFIIPQGRMQNIGAKVESPDETITDDESIIDKLSHKKNLDNVEADEL